jgi:hypothetical protein
MLLYTVNRMRILEFVLTYFCGLPCGPCKFFALLKLKRTAETAERAKGYAKLREGT